MRPSSRRPLAVREPCRKPQLVSSDLSDSVKMTATENQPRPSTA